MNGPLTQVKGILQITPNRWRDLIQNLPPELLTRQPTPDHWSAIQCLQHIIDTERVFQFRLQAFLEGRDSFPGFDPDVEGSQRGASPEPEALLQEFTGLRRYSLKRLDGVTAEHLERRSRHAELGPVTLNEMVHEWAAHDLNHTVQAERALMQPFIQASGLWQPFFADHEILS